MNLGMVITSLWKPVFVRPESMVQKSTCSLEIIWVSWHTPKRR